MSSIHHKFARNPPKTQSGWYCQACGYFTPRLDAKERAFECRRATPAYLEEMAEHAPKTSDFLP